MNARFLLRPNALVLVRLAPAAAAGLLLAVTAATTQLVPLARGIAIALIIASVLVAFLPKRDDVKTHGSVTAAVIAVAATGQTRTGLEYQRSAPRSSRCSCSRCLRAPLVAARLRAPKASDGGPASWRNGPLAVLAVVTAAITASLVFALPRLSAIVEREVQRLAGNVARPTTTRSASTRSSAIGSLRHMLKGNRVVMRVTGEPVEYLRGAVLDRYDARIWSSTQSTTVTVPADAPDERATTRIELSRAALSGRTVDPRWFLPDDACDLHTPSGTARARRPRHGASCSAERGPRDLVPPRGRRRLHEPPPRRAPCRNAATSASPRRSTTSSPRSRSPGPHERDHAARGARGDHPASSRATRTRSRTASEGQRRPRRRVPPEAPRRPLRALRVGDGAPGALPRDPHAHRRRLSRRRGQRDHRRLRRARSQRAHLGRGVHRGPLAVVRSHAGLGAPACGRARAAGST